MSYDLQVFSEQALSTEALRRLITEAGLAVDAAGEMTDSLTVVRGARGRYCFTLGRPVPVEAEDVPEEVSAVSLAPSYLYELMVEGSSDTEIPHAVRFARRLAQASGGVFLDQQTDGVWARGKLRTAPPVPRGTIDIVQAHWYVRPDGAGAHAASGWLDLARRYLPEALPRRFGTYEPLSMKLDVEGPDSFIAATTVEGSSDTVYFKASAPCIEGHIAPASSAPRVSSHSLSVHRAALDDSRWRAALHRLFVGFAIETDALFACAEVQRGVGWSGRGTWFGADAERTAYLAAGGRWAGPPPYPVWWAWFGADYLPLLLDHLPGDRIERAGGGVFVAYSEDPADRDQLADALMPPDARPQSPRTLGRALSRLFIRAAPPARIPPWLPAELLSTVDGSNPRAYSPALMPAATMPPDLLTAGH